MAPSGISRRRQEVALKTPDPLTGEEIEKIVAQLFKMDASLVKLKEILK